MFNLKYNELKTYILERVQDQSLVKKMTSIALGIALSRTLQMPSSEATYGDSFFNEFLAVEAAHKAAEFNENFIVDIDLVTQTARSFWLVRYNNTYPPVVLPLPMDNVGHFMSAIAGSLHLINPNTLEFCQEHAKVMTAVINRVREITG